MRVYLAQLSCVSMIGLVACGPHISTSHRTEVANNKSDDNQQARRAAFSGDDIAKIEASPAEVSYEPWTINQLRLIGTFPDTSQGSISDGVTWSVKTGDSSKLVIDKAQGIIAANANGDYTFTAKWSGKETDAKVSFKYVSGSAYTDVPNPFKLEVTELSSTSVKLTWNLPADFVTGFAISFNKSTAPLYCFKSDEVVQTPPVPSTVQYVADALPQDKLDYTITGLQAGTTYYFRVCSLQSIKLGNKSLDRKSTGALVSEDLSP